PSFPRQSEPEMGMFSGSTMRPHGTRGKGATMDPNATVELINEFIAAGQFAEAIDSIADLERWIYRGGFTPDKGIRVSIRSLRLLKRSMLRETFGATTINEGD